MGSWIRFQSTLPVWGATLAKAESYSGLIFQSTLPVWGATTTGSLAIIKVNGFQSTLPVWGATWT